MRRSEWDLKQASACAKTASQALHGHLAFAASDRDVYPQGDTRQKTRRPVKILCTLAQQLAIHVVQRIARDDQHQCEGAEQRSGCAITFSHPCVTDMRPPQHSKQVKHCHGGRAVQLHAPSEHQGSAFAAVIQKMQDQPGEPRNQQGSKYPIDQPAPSRTKAKSAFAQMEGEAW